jgi:glucokinase
LELDLLRYLQDRFDHVSCERICSGLGLPNIYSFLKDNGYAKEPAWLAEKLTSADDPTPIIVQAALADMAHVDPDGADAERASDPTSAASEGERQCKLCTLTLDIFVSVLGTEAGDLALKLLTTGGVYLGGGIPPRIVPALEQERFLKAFQHKGRFAALMADIPVHIILNPKIALLGAACRGLEM